MNVLSRRSLFTAFPGLLGLSGCYSASGLENASRLALRLGPAGGVDFNSTAEQTIDIAHGTGAKPATHQVILVDVIPDDPGVDVGAVRWASGYPVYDEAASTDTVVRVLVKFAAPAGVPATGRARILFELSS